MDVAHVEHSARAALIDHGYAAVLLDLGLRIARSHAANITTDPGLDGRGFGITVRFALLHE